MVRKLLKKYDYPPDGVDDAIGTVIGQCEMWADHMEDEATGPRGNVIQYPNLLIERKSGLPMVAEDAAEGYGASGNKEK